MKAIIFKEIRECSVVCLVMLIVLGATMAGVVYHGSITATPLTTPIFCVVTGFGYPALGVWLGLTQIMVDRRRGRWDFVTHRPISRSRIFFAKAITGSGIYFLTGIIPLIATALWVATPGHLAAPFDWHMLLPRLSDLFGGWVWYFAGMLVGARRARWIGSRLLPQGLAIVSSMMAITVAMNLLEACGFFAGALVILIPAAWGAFVFGGEYESQPLAVRFFQGASVGPGAVFVVLIVAALLMGLFNLVFPEKRSQAYAFYKVDANGRVVQGIYDANGVQEFVDLNGKPISGTGARDIQYNSAPMGNVSLQDPNSSNIPRSIRVSRFGFQESEVYSQDLYGGFGTNWFYVPDRRTIEGYDTLTRRFIGSLGPGGFADASSSPQQFPEPMQVMEGSPNKILAGPTTAYLFSPNTRTVSEIFKTAPDDPIIETGYIYESPRAATTLPDTWTVDNMVETKSAIHVVQDGRELMRVPLEHGYPPYTNMSVYRVSGDRYFFQYTYGFLPDGSSVGDWIVEANIHGKILSRQQLPQPPEERSSNSLRDGIPAILAIPPTLVFSSPEVRNLLNVEIVPAVVSLVSATVTVLLLGRCSPKPGMKITWAIIGAAMGIPGVLLLLCMRQRIASQNCPSCGKPRLVSEEECEHCRANFAPPPMLGIEIFEMV